MDALQDMYLRCDWDMSPGFIAFLYGDCDQEHALRLRKWAVAMLAWTLHGGEMEPSIASQFERLFATFPKLTDDYCVHLEKMAASKADVRIKNPQLRLPMNKLRSEERFFGFRQCSFHSHRSTVGEGICPHLLAHCPSAAGGMSISSSSSSSPRAPAQGGGGAVAATAAAELNDGSDTEQPIITPLCDMETSFLDLS